MKPKEDIIFCFYCFILDSFYAFFSYLFLLPFSLFSYLLAYATEPLRVGRLSGTGSNNLASRGNRFSQLVYFQEIRTL